MTTDVSSEVVKCPNCKEDVPKTLYCLNCGYPLYKQDKLVEEQPPKDEAEVIKVEEKASELQVEEVKEPELVEPEAPEVEGKATEPSVVEVKSIEAEEPDDVVMQVEDEKPTEPEAAVPEPLITEKVEEVKTEPEELKVEEAAVPMEPEPVKIEEQATIESAVPVVEEPKAAEPEVVITDEPVKIEPEALAEPEIKTEEPAKVETEVHKTEEKPIEPTAPEPEAVKVDDIAFEATIPSEQNAVKVEELLAEPEAAKAEEMVVVEPAVPEVIKVDEPMPLMPSKVDDPAEIKPEVMVEEKTVESVAVVDASKETEISVEDTNLSASSTRLSAEVTKMLDSYEENTITPAYVPDSLTKDLMESIAKNLTLKIRLVNILREGKIKEETFDRLYKGYVEEGQIWISRREELIKKLILEIDEMEETYTNSVQALELLEVKKGIGETSEDEYLAKMPGYRWDVDHLDFEIGKKKNRLAYLEAMNSVLPNDQISELKELASTQYNTVESLEVSNEEIIANIKSSLYDAIKILG